MNFNLLKALIDGLNKQHDDEQARRKAQQLAQQQQQERATKNCIAHLLADSLNTLPNSIDFTRKIDPLAIRITKKSQNCYSAEIPDACEKHEKRTFQFHLRNALDIILPNINSDAENEFLTTLQTLSNSIYDEMSYNENCQRYTEFFDFFAYKLIKLNILSIVWQDNVLRISFTIDLSDVSKFAPRNIGYDINYGFYIN